jgi:hypothetical protein
MQIAESQHLLFLHFWTLDIGYVAWLERQWSDIGIFPLYFSPGLVSDSEQILQHAAFVFLSFQDTGDQQTLWYF